MIRIGELTEKEMDERLNDICLDMDQHAAQAREIARKAWKAGNFKKHQKYCAVARVWQMCSSKVFDVTIFPPL